MGEKQNHYTQYSSLKLSMLTNTEKTRNVEQCELSMADRYNPPPRYKLPAAGSPSAPTEDPTTDYMNMLGMVCSMCGLMMRVSICTILNYSKFMLWM